MNLLAVAKFGTRSTLFGREFSKRSKVRCCSNSYLFSQTLGHTHAKFAHNMDLYRQYRKVISNQKWCLANKCFSFFQGGFLLEGVFIEIGITVIFV